MRGKKNPSPFIFSLSHHTLICSCLQDYADTELLLSRANVDQAALLSYACEAADFSTNRRLPALDFAINHYGLPDVAMFDFTCMHRAEHASLVRERRGKKLLMGLVGDSLVEVGPVRPFTGHVTSRTLHPPVQRTACYSCFCPDMGSKAHPVM